MITKRTLVNVITFVGATFLLVYFAATQLVFATRGGRTLNIEFADTGGLAPRNDVTMRGVPVGAIDTVSLTDNGTVEVAIALDPGVEVPDGSTVEVNRRSPIGDLTIEITPGKGKTLPDGGKIPMERTTPPPDAERTIEVLAQVLHSVPSSDLTTVVSELATALNGRGEDLGSLSETTADIPEELLTVQQQLRDLITTGPEVTGVFADNAKALADDITQTALLADTLRDNRFDLVDLSKNGAVFAEVANDIIASQKANIACLLADFGDINAALAEPQNLQNLNATLELNHFFFDGVRIAVREAKDGLAWFRVFLEPPTNPSGQAYEPHRPPPTVLPGNACHSIYGTGVGPVTQSGPVWLANGSRIDPGQP